MNVCHVITGLNTGGAEVMLQKLVAATAGNGITHTVVSLIDRGPIGDALAARGIRVEALGMRRGVPDVRGLVALRALIGQCRPQVVQTWMYHANLLGGAAARLAGVRAVVWNIRAARLERSSEKRSTIWIARQSGKVARYLCCRIVTNSEDARHVHEQMGYPSRLFAVIPNGFDLATFRPDANARREVRAELGLVPEAPLIGMVSRFHPGKEHRTFVEAAGNWPRAGRTSISSWRATGSTPRTRPWPNGLRARGSADACTCSEAARTHLACSRRWTCPR